MSGLHLESRSKHKIRVTMKSSVRDTFLYAPIIDPYIVLIPFAEDFLDGDISSFGGGARQVAERVYVTNATCRDDTRLTWKFGSSKVHYDIGYRGMY